MKYHLRISLILFVFIVLTPSSIATELQSIEAITPASTYLNIANNLYVSSSNVGIGTTAPVSTLDIAGGARFYLNDRRWNYADDDAGTEGTSFEMTPEYWIKYGGVDIPQKTCEDPSAGSDFCIVSHDYWNYHWWTWAYFNSPWSQTVTFTSDDQSAIYVNGVKQGSRQGGSGTATATISFNPGWNKVDIYVHEHAGAQNFDWSIKLSDEAIFMSSYPPGGPTSLVSTQGTVGFQNDAYFMGNVGIGTTSPSYKLHVNGNFYADTVNTGIGNTEVYLMNQNVRTTDAVTFATVNTGQGANELYAMNQNVRTTDSPSFAGLNVDSGTLYVDSANNRVGIGTTSPISKLDVNGNIYASEYWGANRKYFNFGYTNTVYYYHIATLPPTTSGTGDALIIETTGIQTSVNGKGKLKVALGQRNGFWYRKSYDGGNPRVHVVVYKQADGSSEVYVYLPSPSYTSGEVMYYQYGWTNGVTLYDDPSPSTSIPAGTLIFDSNDDSTYPVNDPISVGNGYFNGNVGIGTTAPAQKLHVAGNTQVDGAIVAPEGTLRDDGGGWIRTYGNTGWYSQTYGGGWYMTDSSWIRSYGNKNIYHNTGILRTDGTLQVGSSGGTLNVVNGGNFAYRANVLFANTAGNVGIGTTSPAQKLHVAGNTYVTGYLGVGSSNPVKALDVRGDAYISGNVGIGTTSPQGKLHLTGNLAITRNDVGYSFANLPAMMSSVNDGFILVPTGADPSDLRLYIEDDATDSFSIYGNSCGGVSCWDLSGSSIVATFKAGGNVGIGTTAPADTLDVNGDVRVRGGDIKDSGGTARITFSGTNVIIRVG